MPNYSDTTLNQLIINQLTKSQYEQIVPDPNQLYFVDDGEDYVKDVRVDSTSVVNSDGIAEISSELFQVNVTLTSTTAGTADHSGTEIYEAKAAGKLPYVYLTYSGMGMIATLLRTRFTTQSGVYYRYADFVYSNQQASNTTLSYGFMTIDDNKAVTITWRNKPYIDTIKVDNTNVVSNGAVSLTTATAITALSTASFTPKTGISVTASENAITALTISSFTPKTGINITSSASAITSLVTDSFTPKTGISVTASASAITSLDTDSFTPKTGVSVTSSITAITELNSASITPVTKKTVMLSATYSSGVLTFSTGDSITEGTAVYFATPTPKTTATALNSISLTDGTAINYVKGASTTDTFLKTVSLTDGSAISYVKGVSTTDTFVKSVSLTDGTAFNIATGVSSSATFIKSVSLTDGTQITYVSGASSTQSFIIKP